MVKNGEARGEQRWPVLLAAAVATPAYKQQVSVRDLSTIGCRIQCDYGVPLSGYVLISLNRFAPLDGKIIWSDGNSAGIAFHPPLHPAVLDHIVRENPPKAEAITDEVAAKPEWLSAAQTQST